MATTTAEEKIVKFLVGIKRFIILGVSLFLIGIAWKLFDLRRRAGYLSAATAKILELRLSMIEEHIQMACKGINSKEIQPAPVLSARGLAQVRSETEVAAAKILTSLLRTSPWLEEAAWIRGNGKGSLQLTRINGSISEKIPAEPARFGALSDAHKKGRMVVSLLEYRADKIPSFRLSYPLDGQEGGFVAAKVNLWDFLKPPTAAAQELLGGDFDLELRDRQGRLIAHKTSRDPLKAVLARFFSSRSPVKILDFDVRVTTNRTALAAAVKPGRYLWFALGFSVILVALL
ncbi:MAG: hypothetical protein HY747_11160 [Elusimicrobia bacterium]|nr:hypothetical protein [Elusimicrobiota bacterium]